LPLRGGTTCAGDNVTTGEDRRLPGTVGPRAQNLGSLRGSAGNTGCVPLYACERCGFTSAAFRPEAAATHRLEYPECDGVIRIVFRADDRYPAQAHEPPADAALPAAKSQGGQPQCAAPGPAFAMRERLDVDQMLRLTLLGDLDIAGAQRLRARLAKHKAAGRPVRLDLSELAFIDSSGIQALLAALTDARWIGWQLEVARDVSPTVERAAQIVGIAQVLWPQVPGASGSDSAPLGQPAA
jgi:anti-anti-sigma factor